jgi:hypothetical protein
VLRFSKVSSHASLQIVAGGVLNCSPYRLAPASRNRVDPRWYGSMRTTPRTSPFISAQLKTKSTSCLITITLFALLLVSERQSQAQDVALQPPAQNDTLQIAAREQELRRKEEQLLEAMRKAETSSQPNAAIEPASSSSAEPSIQEAAAQKVAVDSPAEEISISSADSSEQVGSRRELRELEQHPALATKKAKAPTSRSSHSSTIKTYAAEDHPDGTTARRLGTYTRVNRDEYQRPTPRRETSQTHTVTLDDIQQEASVRSVSLAREAVATIRHGSTHLRTGPSRLDTNLLSLPQYSEVSIDYRSGSWYRVKTVRGIRGWVPGNSLLFDAGVSPRSAVRIGAVQGKVR